MVVLFSLISAIGISFYMKIPLTMISAEVVPFLILAIGVDNMFLISRAERNVPSHVKEIELRIAYAMKEIGPSIFAAAFCEALAFFIGMLTDVPALYSFCLVAGFSVITDFLLQITFFLAALALDGKRIQENRADIVFCIKKAKVEPQRKEWVRTAFQEYYVPMVFNKYTQGVIFLIAGCLTAISIMSCFKLKLGLNQNVGFVNGSDLYNYFEVLFDYGSAGPPGYLVFNNVDYTIQSNLKNMSEMQVQLATLNGSVISPVYSWVTPFQNYIAGGLWTEACGSDKVMKLDFDN
jgi:predicted RND superfamily exporter protein